MLRIHVNQHWFKMAIEAMETALCDSAALRSSIGIDFGRKPVCDARSVLRDCGLRPSGGTIVNSTLIAAPSSTKNALRHRDSEMRSTKKGNQWHFGMKVHVDTNAKTSLIHVAVVNSANARHKCALRDLLRCDKMRIYGDRGSHARFELIKVAVREAKDFTNRCVRQPWGEDELARAKTRVQNRKPAQVEHLFLVLKRKFGFGKARYRWLAKTGKPLFTTPVPVNLVMALRRTPGLGVRNGRVRPLRAL